MCRRKSKSPKTEKETEQELPVTHPTMLMVLHEGQVKPVHEDVIDRIPIITHYELQWINVGKSYMVPIEKFAQKNSQRFTINECQKMCCSCHKNVTIQ